MELRGKGLGGKDRAALASNRDQWRALVNALLNEFHKMLKNA
jgi:hypothetical protein